MSDTSLIEIHVDDKNDNPPTIVFPNGKNNTVYVSSEAPVDHVVTTIQAYDPDFGPNGTLTYALSEGNEKGEFIVRPNTGEVVMKAAVAIFHQQNEKAKVYPLVIMVQDNGDPKRISIETLNIVVDRSIPLLPITQSSNGAALLQDTQLAIIIAACLGIVLVLGIIFIIVFIRQRRHNRALNEKDAWDNMAPPAEEMPPIPPGVEKEDDYDDVKKPRPASTTSSELGYTYPISSSNSHENFTKPGDSDSGCADVSHTDSQGSDENTKPPPSPPLPPPPPEAGTSAFSDWVHNESFQLQRSGNMYRVSNNNIQRKVVRFNEPAAISPAGTLTRSAISPAGTLTRSPSQNEYTEEPVARSTTPIIAGNSKSTHPLVVYPKTKPLTHSGSNASTNSHPRVTYPQGQGQSQGSRSTTPIVSYVDRGGSNLSLNSPSSHSNPLGSRTNGPKVHFADISNSNKSSHCSNRSVVVPIAPKVGGQKKGVTLQGWSGPTHYTDNDGSLV